ELPVVVRFFEGHAAGKAGLHPGGRMLGRNEASRRAGTFEFRAERPFLLRGEDRANVSGVNQLPLVVGGKQKLADVLLAIEVVTDDQAVGRLPRLGGRGVLFLPAGAIGYAVGRTGK